MKNNLALHIQLSQCNFTYSGCYACSCAESWQAGRPLLRGLAIQLTLGQASSQLPDTYRIATLQAYGRYRLAVLPASITKVFVHFLRYSLVACKVTFCDPLHLSLTALQYKLCN